MHVASSYAADRALRPVRAPRWLPTPARRRARAAVATMLRRDRRDPAGVPGRSDPDAPLVHALIAAADPVTGETALRPRHLQRPADLHARRPRHDGDGADLRAVGAGPSSRGAGPRRRRGCRDRRPRTDARGRAPTRIHPFRCSTRHCGCARPRRGSAGWRCADIAVDGHRVQAGSHRGRRESRRVHRDPDAVGPIPMVFDPDRFSQDARQAPRPRWQFVPFAGGPRSCIGEHFALPGDTLALATIVRPPRIRSLADDFPVEVPYTTVQPSRSGERANTPPTPCS